MALATAWMGAALGSFGWALFADAAKKDPDGWSFILPWGAILTFVAGWSALGVTWTITWITSRQPPLWWMTFIMGCIFGCYGPPVVVVLFSVMEQILR